MDNQITPEDCGLVHKPELCGCADDKGLDLEKMIQTLSEGGTKAVAAIQQDRLLKIMKDRLLLLDICVDYFSKKAWTKVDDNMVPNKEFGIRIMDAIKVVDPVGWQVMQEEVEKQKSSSFTKK